LNLEKIFNYLYHNKKLIVYLFEHRDRVVNISEIEDLANIELLENLSFYEIVELIDNKISLDFRVSSFLEEYVDSNDIVDVAVIGSILKELIHLVENATEFKDKKNKFIPKIRRALFKIDSIFYKNLDILKTHINKTYKSADEFKLKLKELKFYKERLSEFEQMVSSFEQFLQKYTPLLQTLHNDELNTVLKIVKKNKIEFLKTLIPLTSEIISYINKIEAKNILIQKVSKLKELKDSYELSKTNLNDILDKFDLIIGAVRVSNRLNSDILQTEDFAKLIQKQKDKKLKTKVAKSVIINEEKIAQDEVFVNIYLLHRQFLSTNLNLIEFLISSQLLKNKDILYLSQIYCKMILMYEDEYKIDSQKITIDRFTFAKVYSNKG